MRRIPFLAAPLAALAIFVGGCTGNTEPATSVDSDSAILHADVTWNQQDNTNGGTWWWEWSKVSDSFAAGTTISSPHFTIPTCASDPCSSSPTYDTSNVAPLASNTAYYFRLAANINGSSARGDSNGWNPNDDPPYEYDSLTTDPAPSGYPKIPNADLDFAADFDPNCSSSEWNNDYIEHGTKSYPSSGGPAGACYAHVVSDLSSGSPVRLEFGGSSNLPAGSTYERELLIRIPSSTDYTGFLAQQKLDETQGSCAQGGWSFPQDDGNDLQFKVRGGTCSGSYDILHFGEPPRDTWFAVWNKCKVADSGGFCDAAVDPDGTGPQGYGTVQSLDGANGDTAAGGAIKPRIGTYGNMPDGDSADFDGYRQHNLP